jgi:hypothetical protein
MLNIIAEDSSQGQNPQVNGLKNPLKLKHPKNSKSEIGIPGGIMNSPIGDVFGLFSMRTPPSSKKNLEGNNLFESKFNFL